MITRQGLDDSPTTPLVDMPFLSGNTTIHMVDSSTSTDELVELELCLDLPTGFAGQGFSIRILLTCLDKARYPLVHNHPDDNGPLQALDVVSNELCQMTLVQLPEQNYSRRGS